MTRELQEDRGGGGREKVEVGSDVEAWHPRDEDVSGGGLDCFLGKTVPILFLGRNWSLCVLFCSTACNTGHGHVSLRNVVGTVLCIFEIVYVGSASDVKYKPNTAQTSFAGTELQEFFISV